MKGFKKVMSLGSGEFSKVNSYIDENSGLTVAMKSTKIKKLTKLEKKKFKQWAFSWNSLIHPNLTRPLY